MTSRLPQRRIGPFDVGAIGLGCMGMTWAYTHPRDDERSAAVIHRAIELVVPIPGTTKVERVEENAGAAFVELSAGDLAELDAVPPTVGARY